MKKLISFFLFIVATYVTIVPAFAQTGNYSDLLHQYIISFSLDTKIANEFPFNTPIAGINIMLTHFLKRGNTSDSKTVDGLLNILKTIDINEYYEVLGIMYANGDIVQRDCYRSNMYLSLAKTTSARHSKFMAELYGNCDEMSSVEEFNEAKFFAGIDWDTSVCAYSIAEHYLDGRGVIQNYEQAYIWYLIAAATSALKENGDIARNAAQALGKAFHPTKANGLRNDAQKLLDTIKNTKTKESSCIKKSRISYLYGVLPIY